MRSDHLRCEYLENPQGIDSAEPRLSWVLRSKERAEKQTAYQLLVASSAEKLEQGEGDLWNSGKVDSDQSTQVVYGGVPLRSRMRCYWKVQVWGAKGHAAGWSEMAEWSMGLLQPDDWAATWISIDRKERPLDSHDSPMLRKVFRVAKEVRSAQISICGLGYYELLLNGTKVGDHVLDPAWTTYHKSSLYVTYDLTSALDAGPNALGVQLANGVYNQEFEDAWDFQRAPWRAYPQLLLQLDIVYVDGSRERVASDPSWKASTGPIEWDQLRMGVMYDARKEQPGWARAEFDDSTWTPAVQREGITGKLSAQMSEPIKVMKTLKAVDIQAGDDGEYTFDFGQNIAGWTRLKVTGKAGTKVTLDHGSHGLVRGEPLQTNVYTLKGTGPETWEPGFTYHGFQRVTVSGLPSAPDTDTVDARVVYTAFRDRGSFECSSPLLNKIVKMSRWSYRGNFVGIPTDCPHREKNGWSADAHLAAELGLTYFGAEAAYTRWMLDYEAAQAEDGKLPCIIPDGGDSWGMSFLDGPAWESAYLVIPWHIYEYRGDRRILEYHYENYKRWLSWYRDEAKVIEKKDIQGLNERGTRYSNPMKVNQNDIICYGIGDWPPNGQTPFEITSTAYYYHSATIISQIAGWLGRKAEKDEYSTLATRVKTAFNREFYNDETGTYSEGSQTGLSCALFFGLVEEKNRKRTAENLVRAVRENHYRPQVGCLGSKYLLRALADNGELETAYRILTNEESPGWGFLAASERTTLSESLDGSGSDNHVFLGDVAAWMMQCLAGVRHDPAHPGYKRFLIKPEVVEDLEWVKAHHDSPYGRIVSEWRREDDSFSLKITVPANSTANVYFPASHPRVVSESGKPAAKANGVTFLRMENGRVVYEVGSGRYHFECKEKVI
ncbi:MAG: family 78 glycoside hydrolase catalytic domain [Verrucomicrobia bacterium]|jgi:alpha-L-rhamnosidase|nr:family 78 glycoside hydrolase catalytic domain [Verrucomicrobiota bacterium]